MRKLASVQLISDVKTIPNADAICAYKVGGWWVVDRVGQYSVGDKVIYCEIDSWIPHTTAPFLSKGQQPSTYEGVEGARLRSIKLRGQLSQGLLLPMSSLQKDCDVGTDVSADLNIIKWEAQIPAQLAGEARGVFPSIIPKTDQTRVQSIGNELKTYAKQKLVFEVTEKLEGSSCTMYMDDDWDFHVCSRNLDLKESDSNTFWAVAKQYSVQSKMMLLGVKGYAIQGELVGPGIQGNIYKLNKHDFYVFDVFDSTHARYLTACERATFIAKLGLKSVPVIDRTAGVSDDVDKLLLAAEGRSVIGHTEREGIVFKCETDPTVSFKAISNKYLLKDGQ